MFFSKIISTLKLREPFLAKSSILLKSLLERSWYMNSDNLVLTQNIQALRFETSSTTEIKTSAYPE